YLPNTRALPAYIPKLLQYTVARKVRPGYSDNHPQLIQPSGCTRSWVRPIRHAVLGPDWSFNQGLEEGT
ncbi:MAG TPA: hypothetical protein VNM47_05060, partial [Terriglobia bacterium]|nr:hypothetical protein [Terriglobia bacterium]